MLSRSVVSDFLGPHGLLPTRLLCLWDFSGKKKVLKSLELIIIMKSTITATEKREKKKKIQNQLQKILIKM